MTQDTYTWDEARKRLATAREQLLQGKYMTHDQVMNSQALQKAQKILSYS